MIPDLPNHITVSVVLPSLILTFVGVGVHDVIVDNRKKR